jgi:uncharacterized protein
MSAHPIEPLGIGLPYIASLPADMYRLDLIDFVEITPETICRRRAIGRTAAAIEIIPDQLKRAQDVCGSLPVVVHGVELSIGSAHGCNRAYLDMLDQFQREWPFLWHSEHLGFQTIPGEGPDSLDVGVPLPLPPVREAVNLVAERSAAIIRRYGVPFLLENAAHYLSTLPVDPDVGDDVGLMNAISERSGCFQLLDLHNVHCNAINHGMDPFVAIDHMALDSVVEVHVAGGSWRDGFWMDAHDGPVPERVWDLLTYTLPKAPHVAGIVFEIFEEHARTAGATLITQQLQRARNIRNRCTRVAS